MKFPEFQQIDPISIADDRNMSHFVLCFWFFFVAGRGPCSLPHQRLPTRPGLSDREAGSVFGKVGPLAGSSRVAWPRRPPGFAVSAVAEKLKSKIHVRVPCSLSPCRHNPPSTPQRRNAGEYPRLLWVTPPPLPVPCWQ